MIRPVFQRPQMDVIIRRMHQRMLPLKPQGRLAAALKKPGQIRTTLFGELKNLQ